MSTLVLPSTSALSTWGLHYKLLCRVLRGFEVLYSMVCSGEEQAFILDMGWLALSPPVR